MSKLKKKKRNILKIYKTIQKTNNPYQKDKITLYKLEQPLKSIEPLNYNQMRKQRFLFISQKFKTVFIILEIYSQPDNS